MSLDNAVTRLNGEDLTKLLGRIAAHDPADYPLRSALRRGITTFPTRKAWRTGPILNQGLVVCPQKDTTHLFCREHGFCGGAGGEGWLRAEPRRTGIGPGMLDIYHLAQTMDEWPGEAYAGTSVRAVMKVMQRLGYLETYSAPANPMEVRAGLTLVSTMLIGIDWTEQMFFPDAKGFITPGGWLAGGHCVLVNLIDASAKSVDDWIYGGPNSWGRGWGWRGRWRMRGKHFHELLFNRWGEAFFATEVRPARA